MYAENTKPATPRLWFGKYREVPLPDVPTSYLRWALANVRLSSGIRQAALGLAGSFQCALDHFDVQHRSVLS